MEKVEILYLTGAGTLKPLPCNFCTKNNITNHICRVPNNEGSRAICRDPKKPSDLERICGLATCIDYALKYGIEGQENRCFINSNEQVHQTYLNVYEEICIENEYNERLIGGPSNIGINNSNVITHYCGPIMSAFGSRPKCVICRIEANWYHQLNVTGRRGSGPKLMASMGQCMTWFVIAHRCTVDVPGRKIGIIFDGIFKDMTCWEIAHHPLCDKLYRFKSKQIKNKQTGETRIVKNMHLNIKHKVYLECKRIYGVKSKINKKKDKKKNSSQEEETNATEDV